MKNKEIFLEQMNELKKLQNFYPRFQIEKREYEIKVSFFDLKFIINPVNIRIIVDQFFLDLVFHLADIPNLNQKINDSEYQKFWQYILKYKHQYIFQNRLSNLESLAFRIQVAKLVISFSPETLNIYRAIRAIYELKL